MVQGFFKDITHRNAVFCNSIDIVCFHLNEINAGKMFLKIIFPSLQIPREKHGFLLPTPKPC
jgi:hypothetical protein